MGEFEKAKENCLASFDIAKNDGERRFALFTLAVANVYQGNTDEAIDLMNKQYAIAEAIGDDGAMANDLAIMGNILYEAGRYNEAQAKYEESLAVTEASNLSVEVKENAKRITLYRQGRILLRNGKLAEAKDIAMKFSKEANTANNTFQIWLSHDLNGIIALNEQNYKKAYAGENDKEKAKELCAKAANFNALTSMNQAFVTKKAKDMMASL
jgi:tetratricopeptide (TPR) repeat protein